MMEFVTYDKPEIEIVFFLGFLGILKSWSQILFISIMYLDTRMCGRPDIVTIIVSQP